MAAIFLSGCSGEPTYAKPTATGVKSKETFNPKSGDSKIAPVGKD
jgi:hypothetical protein